MVPAQCWLRVVKVVVPSGFGSGVTISRHGEEWLVTARHVVDGVLPQDIAIEWQGVPADVTLAAVPQVNPGADIQVYSMNKAFRPDLTLSPTSDGAVFAQDAYFLGFPYGLGLKGNGVAELPFVKKAIFSSFEKSVDGVTMWMLDGINNPGFSGGPVVFQRTGTKEWHVAAIVSAYRTEQVAVQGGSGFVHANTGIVIAYDIGHATDAIDAMVS